MNVAKLMLEVIYEHPVALLSPIGPTCEVDEALIQRKGVNNTLAPIASTNYQHLLPFTLRRGYVCVWP